MIGLLRMKLRNWLEIHDDIFQLHQELTNVRQELRGRIREQNEMLYEFGLEIRQFEKTIKRIALKVALDDAQKIGEERA